MVSQLGRGINMGNLFEAAPDHPWPLPLRTNHIDAVRAAGFDTVRLPVRWSAHTEPAPPYRIDPAFAARVDEVVDTVLARGLNLVLNVHHFDELNEDPDRYADQFLAIWGQLAPRYADRPPQLVFELLNEPRDAMTPDRWNELHPLALQAVRQTNAERSVVLGPARLSNVEGLADLVPPADDHLIATVHYYAPFPFTHQGAPWLDGTDAWLGTGWGDPADHEADHEAVRADLAGAAEWAARHRLPLLLGEFGAFHRADLAARARWTRCVRSTAEALGMSWTYWEFGTDFGAYDLAAGAWHEPLRQALLDD